MSSITGSGSASSMSAKEFQTEYNQLRKENFDLKLKYAAYICAVSVMSFTLANSWRVSLSWLLHE